jgi:pimeloyl-ACP methyl ester carboxylesterase
MPVDRSSDSAVHHRSVQVDGLDIFYREAGPSNAPTLLLLHGFPTSSHMFRDLIPLLARDFHLVAPDYPGFGYSSAPAPAEFAYTFDHLADVLEHFVDAAGLRRYALYMQDFGGPVGLRLATRRPKAVSGLVVQNANAYREGITPGLDAVVLRAWRERSAETDANLRALFEMPTTRRQFLEGAVDPSRVSPDSWHHAQWGMERPGNKAIQLELHRNYGSNIERYDEWHAYFRANTPPTLVVWGKNDFVFAAEGAAAYRQDLPHAEIHLLDAGHFALETHATEIADRIRAFAPSFEGRRQGL